MCVASMIQQHYHDKWYDYLIQPHVNPFTPIPVSISPVVPPKPASPEEPVKLPPKEEIEEFYRLLERAREYDRKHNQPDCDTEAKKAQVRQLAELLGVDVKSL